MPQKLKEKLTIGEQIQAHFDQNQSWLAKQIGMSEGQLSKKINGHKDWTQSDLDKINKVLGTSFKLNN